MDLQPTEVSHFWDRRRAGDGLLYHRTVVSQIWETTNLALLHDGLLHLSYLGSGE